MAKYNITIVRTDEYEIEVDEAVWTETALKEWSEVFQPAENTKDIAEILAHAICRQGSSESFYEGFVHVRKVLESGHVLSNFKNGFEVVSREEELRSGLTALIISEDNDYETRIKEMSV